MLTLSSLVLCIYPPVLGLLEPCHSCFQASYLADTTICVNNTTSLPLLLLQSLEATGILSRLIIDDTDTESDAIKRAKSYFLVASIVSNSLAFALGPRLIEGEEPQADEDTGADGDEQGAHGDIEEAQGQQDDEQEQEEHPDEKKTLLPDGLYRREQNAEGSAYKKGKKHWDRLSPRTQSVLDILYAFINAPIIGAVIGVVLGLVPALHKVFFSDSEYGGIFNAWLTSSVKNIGDLFAIL